MKYLHTMVRVSDLDRALGFFCGGLGLKEVSRFDNPGGRFTLVFLAAPEDVEAFVKAESPDAWAKVIDKLLASPR